MLSYAIITVNILLKAHDGEKCYQQKTPGMHP